jgi:hypothetical protein
MDWKKTLTTNTILNHSPFQGLNTIGIPCHIDNLDLNNNTDPIITVLAGEIACLKLQLEKQKSIANKFADKCDYHIDSISNLKKTEPP